MRRRRANHAVAPATAANASPTAIGTVGCTPAAVVGRTVNATLSPITGSSRSGRYRTESVLPRVEVVERHMGLLAGADLGGLGGAGATGGWVDGVLVEGEGLGDLVDAAKVRWA
jgi:hypothetical protein